jgi:thioredoxin-related protein
MIDRRSFVAWTGAAAAIAALPARAARLGDDGLHKQDWFLDSFLELGSDLEEAAAAGKGLMVLFEQRGCPYCRELHEVNFARAELVDYLTARFNVVQLDIWGAREVTDFDGRAVEERRLARLWGINFTPTTVLFPARAAGAASATEAEVFRMPGFFKPFHYLAALEYVAEGHFADGPFQRYLQDKFTELEAKGIKPDVW